MRSDYLDSKVLRTGRKVGRTLYLTPVEDPDGDGRLIGMVDTIEIAIEMVDRWNRRNLQDASIDSAVQRIASLESRLKAANEEAMRLKGIIQATRRELVAMMDEA